MIPADTTLVDTHYVRPGLAAAWLIHDSGEAAFVETNTTLAVPRLLAALEQQGLAAEAVRWVVVTHVHLDHAGGAGALLRHLPHARLVVHPRGARHLVDPTRLIAGATAVYGQETMDALYGEILPAPQERVHVPEDGERLPLGQRELLLLDTPGHARHHLAVLDTATASAFTGDVLGLAYPALHTPGGPLIFPTTAPTQLDPPAMRASIQRILEHDPERLLLTHFGEHEDPEGAADEVLALLDAWEEEARRLAAMGPGEAREKALTEMISGSLVRRYRQLGGTLPQEELLSWLQMDAKINAQGWEGWLRRPMPAGG